MTKNRFITNKRFFKFFSLRLIIISLIFFFGKVLSSNIPFHIEYFFNIYNVHIGNFHNTFLIGLFTLISIFYIGIVIINGILTIFRLTDNMSLTNILSNVIKMKTKGNILVFSNSFRLKLFKNLGYHFRNNYDVVFFYIAICSSFFFLNGNPIINRYYGLYSVNMEYGSEAKDKIILISKRNKEATNEIKDSLVREHFHKSTYVSDNEYSEYKIEKTGFLFVQTGIINGFNFKGHSIKGLSSYIISLLISFIEVMINIFIFIILPYIFLVKLQLPYGTKEYIETKPSKDIADKL